MKEYVRIKLSAVARPAKSMMLGAAMAGFLAVTAAGLMSHTASAAALPAPKVFAASSGYCNSGFLGLEPWYHFMPADELGYNGDPCAIHCFNFFPQGNPNDCGETSSDIPGVILSIVDDLLRVAAIVAVIFVIIGSFEFVGSRGNSERASSAQSTILNALIGLAISLVAVGLVAYLGSKLGG